LKNKISKKIIITINGNIYAFNGYMLGINAIMLEFYI